MSSRKRLRGFAPVLDAQVRTLVLGSFPSEASLAAGQYYAHPRNQFWTVLARLIDEPLPELEYPARLRRVLAHRIGIWDVLGACERDGSLDARIRRERANDFVRLKAEAPQLRRVIFNGSTAGRFAREFTAAGFETRIVPSTSPAHASRTLQEKLELWREALHGA
jgi:hypoxanthine-DNA glycosylase